MDHLPTNLLAALLEVSEIAHLVPPELRGVGFYRIYPTCNPRADQAARERTFALEWALRNGNGRNELLGSLLYPTAYGTMDPRLPRNPREWEVARVVAATFAQWLGTISGQAFIKETLAKAAAANTKPPD